MAFIMLTIGSGKDVYYNIDRIESISQNKNNKMADVWLIDTPAPINTINTFEWVIETIKDKLEK